MQGNRKLLCGTAMRSNCSCDTHSTTRHVSCKKGSISSAARTCSPLLLLLLLWNVAGFRGQRQEGWGDGVIVSGSMCIRHPHENGRAVFSDSSTLRLGSKKVHFQALHFQDLRERSAQTDATRVHFCKRAFLCGRPHSLSFGAVNILVKCWEGFVQWDVIKIPSDDNKCVRMLHLWQAVLTFNRTTLLWISQMKIMTSNNWIEDIWKRSFSLEEFNCRYPECSF